MQLRQFKYSQADIDGLVDERLDFPHFDTDQLLVEDFEAQAVWPVDEHLALLLGFVELAINALLLILAGFHVYRVLH